eukprot:jgi/Chrzof1/5552/Cz16g07090.t1
MKQASRESTLTSFSQEPAGVLLCTDLAARGLDIPDVAWIVQFDPPQDPAAFVHRVGRTARMGRSGNAVLYLTPHEVTYVNFLKLRKIPLHPGALPQPTPDGSSNKPPPLLPWLRAEAESDREVMEKATRAFVSFVRGYKEHHCKFIFRIQDLDLAKLGNAFGVLRLPKMPEVKKAKGLEAFVPSKVDPDSVKFRDKQREKQRQQVLKQRQAQQSSEQQQQQAQQKQPKASEQADNKKLPAAKRRLLQHRDDLAELTHDYGLLKKLKKGKISQHQFDVATGLSSDDDEDMMNGRSGRIHNGASGRAHAHDETPAPGSSDDEAAASLGNSSDSGRSQAEQAMPLVQHVRQKSTTHEGTSSKQAAKLALHKRPSKKKASGHRLASSVHH